MTVKAVIARSKGAEVETVNIVVPDPGPNDVIVRVQACGVCHTDLAYRDGDIEDAFPFLLGHEAAGVVETVGSAVTHVEEGDFVILNWRAVCGECRACKKGEPKYCFNTHNASKKMTLEDGTELTPALGIGSFAEKTLVHEGQCTKVEDTDPAAAGLFGCGGVGMAAIAGAKLAAAAKIIAVDIDESKLETAREFGATDTICSKDLSEQEVIDAVRELTGGFGTDVSIDAVGIQPTWRQAFYSRDHAGRMVMVGVPNLTDHVDIPAIDLYGRGGSIKPAWYGDCLPERDFPAYVALSKAGNFPLEKFVSERIALDDVEQAFATMKSGKVLRSVVEF